MNKLMLHQSEIYNRKSCAQCGDGMWDSWFVFMWRFVGVCWGLLRLGSIVLLKFVLVSNYCWQQVFPVSPYAIPSVLHVP